MGRKWPAATFTVRAKLYVGAATLFACLGMFAAVGYVAAAIFLCLVMCELWQHREPWFLEDDTRAVLAWQEHKDWACPGCGMDRREAMDKHHHDHYTASAIRCHACAARDRKRKQFTKQEHDDAGLFFVPRELDG